MKPTTRSTNLLIALVSFLVAAPCAALIVLMGNAVLDGMMAALLGFGR